MNTYPIHTLQDTFQKHFHTVVETLLQEYSEDYSYVKSYILEGGKQVRPLLFLEACTLWGKHIEERDLQIASGIELIHNFFLIHDDIMDNDDMRRDKPTLHTYFSKGRSPVAGRGIALVLGDIIYTHAIQLLASHLPKEHTAMIMEQVMDMCAQTAQGQLQEFTAKTLPTMEEVLHFYKKKTALYSIQLPLLLALYQSNSPVHPEYIKEISLHLGTIYQIYDDIIEITGEKKRLTNDRCSDIMRAKMTPLLLDTLPYVDAELKTRIVTAFIEQTPLCLEDEAMILATMSKENIIPRYQAYMQKHIDSLEKILEKAQLHNSSIIQKLIATYRHATPTTT